MSKKDFSRRDFLKLAPLSLFSIAALHRGQLEWARPRPPGRFVSIPVPPEELNVLSQEQREKLLSASRQFLAPEEAMANEVAKEIDFIEGANEHASTMCGPLSISIMKRADLLGAWVQPRDFWLLNPREDLQSAENVFGREFYHWYHFETELSEFDFRSFPLVTGDLLYLHAAGADTFEHILVVNRVDEAGRAYAVTNLFTQTGTIIEERMLYDPNMIGNGQFYLWADRERRNTQGNTGRGGFRVWRVKDGRSLEFPDDLASLHMRRDLDNRLLSGGGNWFAGVREVGGSTYYEFNPYEAFHPSSTIKVPIGMAFYAWLDSQKDIADVDAFLSSKGTGGRVYEQLLHAMIVVSEEPATEALVKRLGNQELETLWTNWGMTSTRVEPRRSSVRDLLYFLEGLYTGKWLSADSRKRMLELMGEYTVNDDTRIGLIRDQLPLGSVIYNKRGSLVQGPRVLGDSGIIQLPPRGRQPERTFCYTFHGLGGDGSSYEALEAKLDEALLIFGEFLTSL